MYCLKTSRALRTYLASLDVECRMNELRTLPPRTLQYFRHRKMSTLQRAPQGKKTVMYWPIEEIGEPPW